MGKLTKLLMAFMVAICAAGCSDKQVVEAPSVKVLRLDSIVNHLGSLPQIDSLPSQAVRPLSDYLYILQLSSGDVRDDVATLARSAAYRMFYPDVQTVYPSLDSLEQALGKMNVLFSQHFPEISLPRYNAVISPYRQSIMSTENELFIALNHYLGMEHPAYSGFNESDRRMRRSEQIPYQVAEAILAGENSYQSDAESTLLNQMLYSGAIARGVLATVDDSDINTLLGWTDNQMATMKKFEKLIWERLASENLLYSTDPNVIGTWMSVEPRFRADDLPGNLGRYFGLRIVDAYLDNNKDVTINDILKPEFYKNEKVLINANYSPEN